MITIYDNNIINNNNIASNIMILIKLIDTVFDIFTVSLHVIANLLRTIFEQVQFSRYSSSSYSFIKLAGAYNSLIFFAYLNVY